jgi:hypothetical protein
MRTRSLETTGCFVAMTDARNDERCLDVTRNFGQEQGTGIRDMGKVSYSSAYAKKPCTYLGF